MDSSWDGIRVGETEILCEAGYGVGTGFSLGARYGARRRGFSMGQGAGGYQASWLVKLLLLRGYKVHGTRRTNLGKRSCWACDEDRKKEEQSSVVGSIARRIEDFVAELSCGAPVRDEKNAFLKALENATENLQLFKRRLLWTLMASLKQLMGAPVSFMLRAMFLLVLYTIQSYAKTEAEFQAFEYAKVHGLDLVSVCPSLIIGPLLQPKMNTGTLLLLNFTRDGVEAVENNDWMVVDVRDVAEALLLVYKKPKAQGRILEKGVICKFSSEKLQKLGWRYRALETSIVDSIEDFYEKGLLDKMRHI
ncbi:hypothetical protein Sjap_003283 [Stephania japonica]|uniref:Uncharacterized protein n=1 Tax=Stephania japonica TaxID=461633 RepID=A0AAP0KNG9_9MAGN